LIYFVRKYNFDLLMLFKKKDFLTTTGKDDSLQTAVRNAIQISFSYLAANLLSILRINQCKGKVNRIPSNHSRKEDGTTGRMASCMLHPQHSSAHNRNKWRARVVISNENCQRLDVSFQCVFLKAGVK